MVEITKDFPGVRALSRVNFSAKKGEIHALVGENGAGKSTLMKILSGVYPYYSYQGKLILFGKEQKFTKPRDAEQAGIAIIHQELMLINELSVAENISLGHLDSRYGLVNWERVNERAKKVLKQLNLEINVRTKVKNLGVGQKQLVEIAKALSLHSKVLILDEPTAALTETEVVQLFNVLRTLKQKGMTLIYISHRMGEVFEIADRISVLRDGQLICTEDRENMTHQKVVSLMVGREITSLFPDAHIEPGEELLKIENYSVPNPDKVGKWVVKGANLAVRAGEIVGIAGLLGSGRTELVSAIFGAYKSKGIGKIYIKGRKVTIKNPKQAIRQGLAFVTEDRKFNGLLLQSSIMQNISLASLKTISKNGLILKPAEKRLAESLVKDLRIKTPGVNIRVSNLSGGNQQKVVLAKWLATKPMILILDEPTRGVDVGAKSEIYQIMKELAANGVGIIMVSSDLPEIIGMSDRIYVTHQGEITAELKKSEATEELIMQYATGTRYEMPKAL
ncbi:sugar ABC transporter ATP-binding protein [Moorella stamsii]